jgi:hypothetical protein
VVEDSDTSSEDEGEVVLVKKRKTTKKAIEPPKRMSQSLSTLTPSVSQNPYYYLNPAYANQLRN